MKKIQNILGFMSALLLCTTVIMKSNHLDGSNVPFLLSGITLSIYLPFFLLFKPAINGRTNGRFTGAISASMLILGITLKFMHWPGAGVMIVLGLSTFALLFIPLQLLEKLQKENTSGKKLMNISGAFGVMLFSLGLLFKIMYWPFASVMLGLSIFFLFPGYFLPYILDHSIDDEAKTSYLKKAFCTVIIGCITASLILVALNKPYLAPTTQETAILQTQH